ncbi:hypothetical protein AVEN_38212-1 [Araneus ventricosus]|uniref:Transposase Tc1-like domain-containing protein n=1 Tax=Araneus ventricosus TaxID=182803 RepID=A0A4Y2UVX4_ARAVE|nr:hypothetical protein AVEN_38212-1 [Araneus ventricosus]
MQFRYSYGKFSMNETLRISHKRISNFTDTSKCHILKPVSLNGKVSNPRFFDRKTETQCNQATVFCGHAGHILKPISLDDFNAGALGNVSVRTVERTIIDTGFRNRCPTRVPLLTVRHTALHSPGPANAAIELLMTGNKLPGLTSLIPNCIGWILQARSSHCVRPQLLCSLGAVPLLFLSLFLYRVDGHVLVWRQPHESMDPTCQQGTV